MVKKMDSMRIKPIFNLKDLSLNLNNEFIKIRGFVSTKRVGGKCSFLVLRQELSTVQCVCSKKVSEAQGTVNIDGSEAAVDISVLSIAEGCLAPSLSEERYKELRKVPVESYVEVWGRVKQAHVESCTFKVLEIEVAAFKVLSSASPELPFSLKDASEHNVCYAKCLDNRSLELRTPHSTAIFRILDGIMHHFRTFLRGKGFTEIKTSKLIECASEGGANVFEVSYFKKKAYLAQSPQLYKQMAVLGGLRRVYEIGHVYRAEESNINRYLSEFVGMDLEMEIETSYVDLIYFIYNMFVYIFDSLKKEYAEEISILKKYFNFEDLRYQQDPLILTFKECHALLHGESEVLEDFNRENEKRLGDIVAEKYGVDFFVIKEYPLHVRAFYTKESAQPGFSNSYDFILRGEEVLSGAQRINEYEELVRSAERCKVDVESIQGYLNAFRNGAPPHGGCGIGLERLVKAFFKSGDIRHFNMFPRDPGRLNP